MKYEAVEISYVIMFSGDIFMCLFLLRGEGGIDDRDREALVTSEDSLGDVLGRKVCFPYSNFTKFNGKFQQLELRNLVKNYLTQNVDSLR